MKKTGVLMTMLMVLVLAGCAGPQVKFFEPLTAKPKFVFIEVVPVEDVFFLKKENIKSEELKTSTDQDAIELGDYFQKALVRELREMGFVVYELGGFVIPQNMLFIKTTIAYLPGEAKKIRMPWMGVKMDFFQYPKVSPIGEIRDGAVAGILREKEVLADFLAKRLANKFSSNFH